jgi:hypothetical protein
VLATTNSALTNIAANMVETVRILSAVIKVTPETDGTTSAPLWCL